jgi:hypothetical protein
MHTIRSHQVHVRFLNSCYIPANLCKTIRYGLCRFNSKQGNFLSKLRRKICKGPHCVHPVCQSHQKCLFPIQARWNIDACTDRTDWVLSEAAEVRHSAISSIDVGGGGKPECVTRMPRALEADERTPCVSSRRAEFMHIRVASSATISYMAIKTTKMLSFSSDLH